ncbi:hypothetical protein K3495_g247 [Podosphaera aphanis]|nr:hypothetical protein K3495_g247 [Podosphaera aphanis]
MDEHSQKSSMSLTQENPISAYQHLLSAIPINQPHPMDTQGSESTDGNHNISTSDLPVVFNHTFGRFNDNNSPVPIYIDNHTDCAKLNHNQDQIETEDDDSDSLDSRRQVSLPKNSLDDFQGYQPHTPALAVNPFKSRGSVMHKLELFAATQPSSINRQAISPVSSRPSPHGYDAFSSPVERKRPLVSPLTGYKAEDTSQISAKGLLTHFGSQGNQSTVNYDSRIQHFDVKFQQSRSPSVHASRSHLSLRENREKRRQANISESQDSNSSLESLPTHQKYDQLPMVQRDSRLKAPLPPVENSTRQHRNLQEQYIAQCEGRKLQNNQQEYVADTQICPVRKNVEVDRLVSNASKPRSDNEYGNIPFPISSIQGNEEQERLVSSLSSNRNSQPELVPSLSESTAKNDHLRGDTLPALPSQEFLIHRALKDENYLYSENPETVPETSPVSQQLPLLEQVATIPSVSKINALDGNIPDFSQEEYENGMATRRSPSLYVSRISNAEKFMLTQKELTTVQHPTVSRPNFIPVARKSQPSPQISNVSDKESHSEIEFLVCAAQKEGLTKKSLSSEKSSNIKPKMCDKVGSHQPTIIDQQHDLADVPLNVKPTTELPDQEIKSRSRSCTRKSKRCSTGKAAIGRSKSLSTARSSKSSPCSSPKASHQSTAKSVALAGSRKSNAAKSLNQKSEKKASNLPPAKRKLKRKSLAIPLLGTPTVASTRSSKRSSLDYSEDPLSAFAPSGLYSPRGSGPLFQNMAFAVSYVRNDKERKAVTRSILENGGLILEDGFDSLFESSSKTNSTIFDSEALSLSKTGKSLCFAAVIADEHSRKTKYVQALALGLPCISGRWIQSCVSKSLILDWSAYLLCAGQSSVLGNACRSRVLQPYSAAEAELSNTFSGRKKILEGKSVLLVTGKGKALEKRKTFNFLTRALGPARVGHVTDISEARKSLLEAETQGREWDLLHVHDNEKNVASDIFNGGGGKRKNVNGAIPCPKRVRIITDEIMIQSLIFGELLDES